MGLTRRLTTGKLIVVEGIDGAGKTTQCERLVEALRAHGWDVERLREPTDSPYGRRIRELARSGRDEVTVDEELDLFIQDRQC
ncbi:dTMP kinase, partial [bacterium]|nr:dTMP kinase [bacterium]